LEQLLPNGTLACRAAGLDAKEEMESLMFAFDSNLKPAVGQQVTLGKRPSAVTLARLQLLVSAAERGDLDLVASSRGRNYRYAAGEFAATDGARFSRARLVDQLRDRAPITFTAVPPGEGVRSCEEHGGG
jgi:hypothetical protein